MYHDLVARQPPRLSTQKSRALLELIAVIYLNTIYGSESAASLVGGLLARVAVNCRLPQPSRSSHHVYLL